MPVPAPVRRTSAGEGVTLEVELLILGGDTGIADQHAGAAGQGGTRGKSALFRA